MERLTYKVKRKREDGWEKSYYTKHNKQELVDALPAHPPVKVKPIEVYHPAGYRVGQCLKCGNIIRDHMKFCFDCGYRLEWGPWEEWEDLYETE